MSRDPGIGALHAIVGRMTESRIAVLVRLASVLERAPGGIVDALLESPRFVLALDKGRAQGPHLSIPSLREDEAPPLCCAVFARAGENAPRSCVLVAGHVGVHDDRPSRGALLAFKEAPRAAVLEIRTMRGPSSATRKPWGVAAVFQNGQRQVVSIFDTALEAEAARKRAETGKARDVACFATVQRFNGYSVGDAWIGPRPDGSDASITDEPTPRFLSAGYHARIIACDGKARAYVDCDALGRAIGHTGWCKTEQGALSSAHRIADRDRLDRARSEHNAGVRGRAQ